MRKVLKEDFYKGIELAKENRDLIYKWLIKTILFIAFCINNYVMIFYREEARILEGLAISLVILCCVIITEEIYKKKR